MVLSNFFPLIFFKSIRWISSNFISLIWGQHFDWHFMFVILWNSVVRMIKCVIILYWRYIEFDWHSMTSHTWLLLSNNNTNNQNRREQWKIQWVCIAIQTFAFATGTWIEITKTYKNTLDSSAQLNSVELNSIEKPYKNTSLLNWKVCQLITWHNSIQLCLS